MDEATRRRALTDQWIWRRNRDLAGLGATPGHRDPAGDQLADDMPGDAWQATRRQQVAARDALGPQPRRVQAMSAKRPAPPRVGEEVPTVRDAPNPVRLRRMPDGTFEPVPGKVTGPFEFGTWARNIDWPGFVDDMITIGTGASGGVKSAAQDVFDKGALVGGLYGFGRAAWDDMTNPKPPPHHKR